MASKKERKLKKYYRRLHKPLETETGARIIKRPKNDGMSPGRLVAVAEWR